MTSATNDYLTVTRKYNSYSEVYEETSAVTLNGATQTKTVSSEYDRIGNRTALVYPSGKRLNYMRDELDRVKYISETSPLLGGAGGVGNITAYQYNGYRMKQRKSSNGTQLDVEYDAMRRITSIQNTVDGIQGTERIAGFDYGYNKEGMRTYENYTPGASEVNQQSKAKVFTYDSLYQITGVKYDVPNPIAEIQSPGTQPYSKQATYQFDNSGNRENLITTLSGQAPVAQAYQANSLNQYTQIDNGIFGYDSVGNMTTGVIYLDDPSVPGTRYPLLATFVYDYQNNLVRAEQVSDSHVLGIYVYDVLGRRVYKNAWDRETSAYQATYFWYSGIECIEETDVTGTTIATYTFGIGIDEALCIEHPVTSDQYPQSGTYWYHTDVLGSVVAVTDSNGSVIERYKYDIYGEATVLAPDGQTVRAESVIGNRILYTGREYDKETGLYYYRARYYHSQLGRFLSTDPIGENRLGNLVAYVSNSPFNYTDFSGLCETCFPFRSLTQKVVLMDEEIEGLKNAIRFMEHAAESFASVEAMAPLYKMSIERLKHLSEYRTEVMSAILFEEYGKLWKSIASIEDPDDILVALKEMSYAIDMQRHEILINPVLSDGSMTESTDEEKGELIRLEQADKAVLYAQATVERMKQAAQKKAKAIKEAEEERQKMKQKAWEKEAAYYGEIGDALPELVKGATIIVGLTQRYTVGSRLTYCGMNAGDYAARSMIEAIVMQNLLNKGLVRYKDERNVRETIRSMIKYPLEEK